MYRAVVKFADLEDNRKIYEVGDEFPRSGFSVSESRLEELSGNKNKAGRPLIEKEEPKSEAKTEKKRKKK